MQIPVTAPLPFAPKKPPVQLHLRQERSDIFPLAISDMPKTSLKNNDDLIVGKGLPGAIAFLRISQGTLRDADTTIDELYAWEFDGPFLRDFMGVKPVGKRDAGAFQHAE